MGFVLSFIHLLLHFNIDTFREFIQLYGVWTYAILFVVIFIETGLVVTPFLPGDSLLFAAGVMAWFGSLSIWAVFLLLALAAVLGDTANYWIGHYLGERAYHIKWIKREYLDRTHGFFEKYGRKTIFLARFVPIVRTFAPFVAGVGRMSYPAFISYNIFGGISWVALFTFGGYFLAKQPIVEKYFSIVVVAIVLISIVPMVYEAVKARRESKQTEARATEVP